MKSTDGSLSDSRTLALSDASVGRFTNYKGEDRRKDLPIWDILEDNFEMIREEALAALNTSYVEDSYRFVFLFFLCSFDLFDIL